MQDFSDSMLPQEKMDAIMAAVDQAVNVKREIELTDKERLKVLKREFVEYLEENTNSEYINVFDSLGLFNTFRDSCSAKNLPKKQKAAIRSWYGKMFKKLCDYEYNKAGGKPKETTPPKHDSFILDTVCGLYLGVVCIPEFKNSLEKAGIKVEFLKTPTTLNLDDAGDVDAAATPIKTAVNVQNEIEEKLENIKQTIYGEIPADLQYDAEVSPHGIKQSQFTSMVDLKLKLHQLEDDGDSQGAKDLANKVAEKAFTSSVNQKIIFHTTEGMIEEAPAK